MAGKPRFRLSAGSAPAEDPAGANLVLALHERGEAQAEADALLLRGLLQVGHGQVQLAQNPI